MRSIVFLLVTFLAGSVNAQQAERVGGVYKVSGIEQIADSYFVVQFESTKKSGRFDLLRLESDHVHFSVKEGQEIRLSAEVLSEKGSTAEISQVLLFLPHVQGFTPVWMLSRKSQKGDLRGSNYLEMHAPQSDYAIF